MTDEVAIKYAIYFLRRVVVLGDEQERLFETVEALERRLQRQTSCTPLRED